MKSRPVKIIGASELLDLFKQKRRIKTFFFKSSPPAPLRNFECPSCHNIFGVQTKFLESTGDSNFRLTCPCCKFEACINEL